MANERIELDLKAAITFKTFVQPRYVFVVTGRCLILWGIPVRFLGFLLLRLFQEPKLHRIPESP